MGQVTHISNLGGSNNGTHTDRTVGRLTRAFKQSHLRGNTPVRPRHPGFIKNVKPLH